MTKKILLTGASGFVGSSLLCGLSSSKFKVDPVYRHPNQSDERSVLVPFIDGKTDWQNALQSVQIVIHCAGLAHRSCEGADVKKYWDVNVHGTVKLAEDALAHGVKKFIFLSTVNVLGDCSEVDKPLNEESPYNPTDIYSLSKAAAELSLTKLCKNSGMDLIIVRPTLVYGSDVKANFLKLLLLVKSGLPLPFGSLECKRSLLSIQNLSDFVVRLVEFDNIGSQTFLVSDAESHSINNIINSIGIALDKRCRLFSVPDAVLKIAFKLFGFGQLEKRLFYPLEVDIEKAKTLLGWRPILTFEEALKSSFGASAKNNLDG